MRIHRTRNFSSVRLFRSSKNQELEKKKLTKFSLIIQILRKLFEERVEGQAMLVEDLKRFFLTTPTWAPSQCKKMRFAWWILGATFPTLFIYRKWVDCKQLRNNKFSAADEWTRRDAMVKKRFQNIYKFRNVKKKNIFQWYTYKKSNLCRKCNFISDFFGDTSGQLLKLL